MKKKVTRNQECRETFAALSEFLDGTLPARDCRELEKHLSGCKPCIEYLDTLRKAIRSCQVYQTVAVPPPLSPAVREAFRRALSKQ